MRFGSPYAAESEGKPFCVLTRSIENKLPHGRGMTPVLLLPDLYINKYMNWYLIRPYTVYALCQYNIHVLYYLNKEKEKAYNINSGNVR